MVVMTGGLLASRGWGQGCWSTPCSAQDAPHRGGPASLSAVPSDRPLGETELYPERLPTTSLAGVFCSEEAYSPVRAPGRGDLGFS